MIDGIGRRPRATAEFVRAVLRLIASVGLTPIVEGVETEEQAAELAQIGAFVGQGFHFGVPMTEDVMLDIARNYWGTRDNPRQRGPSFGLDEPPTATELGLLRPGRAATRIRGR